MTENQPESPAPRPLGQLVFLYPDHCGLVTQLCQLTHRGTLFVAQGVVQEFQGCLKIYHGNSLAENPVDEPGVLK
jgi:hypothetical protein